MSYRKRTILLILLFSILRLITAGAIELGNDEVYYRMYAQYLQYNYFDHPPVIGWLIRLTTLNLWFDNEINIRLGAIISSAAVTWIFYLMGKKLGNAYTGYVAALIYSVTFYGSIISGLFILPDAPQMVFWSLGLYLLTDIACYTHINRSKKRKVLLFGLIIGLAMMCKVSSAFLWVGFLTYIVLYNRAWLKEPVLYVSGLLTLILFYPVIHWNIENHFVTYLYHSHRVDITNGSFSLMAIISFWAGQFFYYNPILFVYMAIALKKAFSNDLPILNSQKRLLLLCSLPLIATAFLISPFQQVLPHWTGPAYSAIILLTASYFTSKLVPKYRPVKRLAAPLKLAIAFFMFICLSAVICINYFPGTIGGKRNPNYGDGDFTLDMYGWRDLKYSFHEIVKSDIENNSMHQPTSIITTNWFTAAHLDYYVTKPLGLNLVAVGDTSAIHQYAWINNMRHPLNYGDDAYCILPSNNYVNIQVAFANYFWQIDSPTIIEQMRGNGICRKFYVWRLRHFLGIKTPALK